MKVYQYVQVAHNPKFEGKVFSSLVKITDEEANYAGEAFLGEIVCIPVPEETQISSPKQPNGLSAIGEVFYGPNGKLKRVQ